MNAFFSRPEYVLLLFARVAGLIVPSPIFGRTSIPARARIAFALVLTYFAFTLYPALPVTQQTTVLGLVLACGTEILFGICIAFILNLFFSLPLIGGQLIDTQIGFSIVSVYDIQNNTQVPIVGNLLNLTMLLIFFGMDGHHYLISVVFRSIESMPLGTVAFNPNIPVIAMEVFVKAFAMGVMVAVPTMAAGILIEFGFGVLMRAVPQLNVFVVGVPLKLFIGLFVLAITIPAFVSFLSPVFSEMMNGVERMFDSFLVGA